MATGYCTPDDVRRALREADLPGDAARDRRIVIDAIAAQTEWFEKEYKRHWFVPGGVDTDPDELIPTSAKTRNDEHDLPTHGGFVHGASERDRPFGRESSDALLEAGPRHDRRRRHRREPTQEIRIALGAPDALDHPVNESPPAYTRIRLDRRDVQAVNELHVINADGGYDDWVASSDFAGGVGTPHRGEDYWVRINNGGVSELYLDVHSLDDDTPSLSNAVYVDIDYGHEGLPRTARRGIANRAAAALAEDAAIQIPANAEVYSVDTLAEVLKEKAEELLNSYRVAL